MKTFTNYFEAMDEIRSMEQPKVGDTVTAYGIQSTIETIYHSEVYTETGHSMFKESKDENTYYIFYDIEFKDTKGNYKHWKSSFDGGYLTRK